MSYSFITQMPLRASADINTCRVIGLSGEYTASQVATQHVEPIGISAEWSFLPPIPDYGLSTLHARSASKDPVSYYGNGQKAHATVGTGGVTNGRVMAAGDGSGDVVQLVAPAWSIGFVAEAAPAGSKVEVYIQIEYVPATE